MYLLNSNPEAALMSKNDAEIHNQGTISCPNTSTPSTPEFST